MGTSADKAEYQDYQDCKDDQYSQNSPKQIQLSVRQLVEFVLRGGSIDNRSGGMDRAAEGARIHRRLQKAGGESYQSEVFFRHTALYKEINFTVEGRADGIIEEGTHCMVDEIKTTRIPLAEIDEEFNRLHWAQAKCYAHFYQKQHPLSEISVRLTYFQVMDEEIPHMKPENEADTDDEKTARGNDEACIKRFIRNFTADELERDFEDLLERYMRWADFSCEWQECRTASIKQLPFPFENYRRGQRTLAVTAYQTIRDGGTIFCQAPTGIGKTISTIFPAVKSMGEGLTQKIFYLTAKTITRQAAEEAFHHMRSQGLRMKSVTLTAKDKICFLEERDCNPIQCPYADGHFDRVNDAVFEILHAHDHMTRERIEQTAREYRVCPFEFALDLTLWCDCIICDYNYLFDPTIYLKRFFSDGKGDYAFLIDEAHNLVDRAREMYSAGLSKSVFWDLKRKIGGSDKRLGKALTAMNAQFIELRKQCGESRQMEQQSALDDFNGELNRFINRCGEWLKRNPSAKDAPDVLQAYFDGLLYLKIADLYDESYVTAVEVSASEVTVKQCCLDPSSLLREAMERGRAAILFSATLTPLDYFSRVLGGGDDARCMALPSPYRQEHLKLLIANRISTRYKDREASYSSIAEMIGKLVQAKKGNYMAYFSSYQYMNAVYEEFCAQFPFMDTVVQQSGMDEQEREAFLARFDADNSETLVGFCVLGGIYSEGIDLKGDRLIGTVIVGVGLPQIGREMERIREYYDRNQQSGYAYAYQYPGMNKVLQAAGRVIRGESDRGVVLLVDDRFNTPSYLRLFPEHWRGCRLVRNVEEMEREIKEFWNLDI